MLPVPPNIATDPTRTRAEREAAAECGRVIRGRVRQPAALHVEVREAPHQRLPGDLRTLFLR